MNENNKSTAAEERKRRDIKGFAFATSSYTYRGYDGNNDYYRLQVSCSIGIKDDYNHPEIETLINLSQGEYENSVITGIINLISTGKQYKAGDRETLTLQYSVQDSCVVEFRESENCYGKCLRAVILGVQEEFQSLPTDDAIYYIQQVNIDESY